MSDKNNKVPEEETKSLVSNSNEVQNNQESSTEQSSERQKVFSIPKDGIRLVMLKYLWGGAAAGACTGYLYGLAKHLPVHPYIATYTMSFGLSSMLFAGVYTKLKENFGRNIATVSTSGAITGAAMGLMLAPKQMPYFLLTFTGAAILCNWSYDLFNYWRVRKGLKMKMERGIITEEEQQKLEDMKHPMRNMSSRFSIPAWMPIKQERRVREETAPNSDEKDKQ